MFGGKGIFIGWGWIRSNFVGVVNCWMPIILSLQCFFAKGKKQELHGTREKQEENSLSLELLRVLVVWRFVAEIW